jgi:hypothetical protein
MRSGILHHVMRWSVGFLYQIVLLYQHQRQQPVGVGIKALLRAA